MTITRVQTAGPIVPWCRGMGCTEVLSWDLVDREDGSGLHALCTELLEPAQLGQPGPTEAQAVALLKDKLGAEPITTVPLPEPGREGTEMAADIYGPTPAPCRDAWCKDKASPCGFDVAAHIAAHGPGILIKGGPAAPKTAPVPVGAPAPILPPSPVPGPTFTAPSLDAATPVQWDAATQASAATLFSAPAGDHPLKAEMIKIIRWYDASRPRSLQRQIGMSEVGVDCLRRLAYSALETPPANVTRDPWFAILGTSAHAWLADALTAWNGAPEYGGPVFHIEQRVTATDGTIVVPGSTDFYRNGVAGDHKLVGADALRKHRDNGPSNQYQIQVQVNGLGWEQAGWPVDEVALLFYPRSGYLDGMHVWSKPYNRQIALDALGRLASVKTTASLLGPAALPAMPDKAGCVWCPFYRPGQPADATGCPGK